MTVSYVICTDTATICVFDVSAMRHRKDDVGDWWSLPSERITEVVGRNALFLDVGSDGAYSISLVEPTDVMKLRGCIASPSGQVYVGPGEEMSGGGFEPTGEWGGFFIDVVGSYQRVSFNVAADEIAISVEPTDPFINAPLDALRIDHAQD